MQFLRLTAATLATAGSLLLAVDAAPTTFRTRQGTTSGLTTSPDDVHDKAYDFVIIGGGLAGLAVAGRLSEDPGVTVLVIEAGNDDRTDPRVYNIHNYGQFYGTELDWSWETTSGKRIGGGKTLGGGSSINGGHYTRGESSQYDAWGTLLNDSCADWGWDEMLKHMKKSEHFFTPNAQQTSAGADYVTDYHGYSGPLQVTFPQYMYAGPYQPNFVEVFSSSLGMVHSPDLNGGNASVVAYTLSMLNPNANYDRASSATTYFGPVENVRTNLLVLTGHQATSIVTDSSSGTVVATNVKFMSSSGGQEYEVSVNKEVVVSAGAIQSPALLQLSGIGPASVLEAAGIDVVLDLPGVGRNLNEQTSTVSGFTPADGVGFDGEGPSDCIAFPSFDILFPDDGDEVRAMLLNASAAYAADAFAAGAIVSEDAGQALFEMQRKLIVDDQVGLGELFADSGYPNGGFGIDTWGLMPFSRGTVEVVSSDPFTYPKVDPRYFSDPAGFDLKVQAAAMRLGRRAFKTAPLSDIISGENQPGTDVVPDTAAGGSYADWSSWIRESFGSVSHPISTCAMMARDLGGVVSGNLVVYGTSNIRVADASVMPLQVSAHLSASIYGIAEMAADLIKFSYSA